MKKLKEIIFSDGMITEYIIKNDKIKVYFEDYNQDNYLLTFSGVIDYSENDCKNHDIFKVKTKKIEPIKHCIEFLDDDLEKMLSIEYQSVKIEKVT